MMISLGLLMIRLVIGISFMGHGAQKLFGMFGGYDPLEPADFWSQSALSRES